MKIVYNKIVDIFMLVIILIISPILWAATDEGKDIKPSSKGEYIIKKGDTLWEISATYLKNPFLWPKIWKENKYILDPNLIYPGNRLNLTPMPKSEEIAKKERIEGKEELPISKDKEKVTPRTEEIEKRLEEEKVSPEKPIETYSSLPVTKDQGSIQQMLPEKPKKGEGFLSDYIISDGIDGGLILGSGDNRNLLGTMDRVYIKTPKGETPNVGDSYTVIRRVKRVIHPKTGRPIGNLIRVLGTIKVVDVSEGLVTAEIIRSDDYITKGDLLIHYEPSSEVSSTIVQEKGRLIGYIVEARDDKEAIGQFDIVYIDRGREDGVSSGDNFHIYREKDRISENLSDEGAIGRIRILSIQEKTSTAEVIKSSDAIEKGYIVERIVK